MNNYQDIFDNIKEETLHYIDEFGQPQIARNEEVKIRSLNILHKDNDLPAYESKEVCVWYVSGKVHRDNAPAVIFNQKNLKYLYQSIWEWYKNGMMHREDGPAELTIDGLLNWYIEDHFVKNGQAIYEATEKQQLVEFLLSPNIGERLFAEHRYKILFEKSEI